MVTPRISGRLKLQLEILVEETSMASRTIRTTAIDLIKTKAPMMLYSMPIVIFVQNPSKSEKNISVNVGGNVDGNIVIGNENKVKEQKAREDAERLALEKAAREKAERETAERAAREKAEHQDEEKVSIPNKAKQVTSKTYVENVSPKNKNVLLGVNIFFGVVVSSLLITEVFISDWSLLGNFGLSVLLIIAGIWMVVVSILSKIYPKK